MRLLDSLSLSSRREAVLAVVCSLLAGFGSVALVALINAMLGHHGAASTLALAFFGATVLVLTTRLFAQILFTRIGGQAVFEVRVRLARLILALPLRRLEEIGAPRLLAVLTTDVAAIALAMPLIPMLVTNVIILLGTFVYMLTISVRTFAVFVVLLAVGVAVLQIPRKKARHLFALAREQNNTLLQNFRAMTEGAKELKIHRERRIAFLDTMLTASAAQYRDLSVRADTMMGAANNWFRMVYWVVIGVIALVGSDVFGIAQATLSAFTVAILYLVTPLDFILAQIPTLTRMSVAFDTIRGLGISLAESGEAEPDAASPSKTSWQRLELRGVTHSYEREGSGKFVLGPVDLTLEPGTVTFLVGGNGSGKSTLAKVLTGLYTPESGAIVLDGEEITDDKREWYRQCFSTVFSDFYLFDSLLGLDAANIDASAHDYLAKLELAHKVKVQNGVLSTTALSQGQRKRLALLTAYLEDRPLYVFDEWASDQDPVFKRVFYEQILPELKRRNKGVVVISHDDQYFSAADRILKLTDGKLSTSGRQR